ncbi:MAG: hypothetical protein V5A62_08500 [Haloarculaceae archaeon]
MASPRKSPGPAAARAFRTGIAVAGGAGLVALGLLYWIGALAPLLVGFTLVVLFPVYLLCAAAVLSKWLGYDRDVSDLRRVTETQGSQSCWERGPR